MLVVLVFIRICAGCGRRLRFGFFIERIGEDNGIRPVPGVVQRVNVEVSIIRQAVDAHIQLAAVQCGVKLVVDIDRRNTGKVVIGFYAQERAVDARAKDRRRKVHAVHVQRQFMHRAGSVCDKEKHGAVFQHRALHAAVFQKLLRHVERTHTGKNYLDLLPVGAVQVDHAHVNRRGAVLPAARHIGVQRIRTFHRRFFGQLRFFRFRRRYIFAAGFLLRSFLRGRLFGCFCRGVFRGTGERFFCDGSARQDAERQHKTEQQRENTQPVTLLRVHLFPPPFPAR